MGNPAVHDEARRVNKECSPKNRATRLWIVSYNEYRHGVIQSCALRYYPNGYFHEWDRTIIHWFSKLGSNYWSSIPPSFLMVASTMNFLWQSLLLWIGIDACLWRRGVVLATADIRCYMVWWLPLLLLVVDTYLPGKPCFAGMAAT